VLDSVQATRLRALIAEHAEGRVPGGPVRGCRGCCGAIRPTPSGRFGSFGARQAVCGQGLQASGTGRPHITDFVSSRCGLVLELVRRMRAERQVRARRAAGLAWKHDVIEF